MTNYVALFRGINVGGKHILPMQELRDILAAFGCENVQTYIQSGNAIFASSARADTLADDIKNAIDDRFGFAPQVLLLTVERFQAIAAANPFPEGEKTPTFLYVWFLTGASVEPDLNALNSIKAPSEQCLLSDCAFYLHAPEGVGRSDLANKVDRHLGVATTARNWRTITRLLELIQVKSGQ